MLSRTTIDKVNDLPIETVIGRYVELKKEGATLSGKSPFVEEKTPSFKVSPSKGIWKCFSSGEGGNNGISFVMKKENCTYPEAIKLIATDHSIEIEYDDSDRAKKYQEETEKIKQISDVNSLALEFFQSNISAIPKEHLRASSEMFEKFGLGYAPNSWDSLQKHLRSKGITNDQMLRAGLIVKGPKGTRDFFINRVMFPIHSPNGKIIGFSGRDVSGEDKAPKYINSKESIAYSKSKSVFGIYQAKHDISKIGFGIKVEGNYDVTSLHSVGATNAFAPLGTAFTEEQAMIIRKYTDVIMLMVDNDAPGKEKIKQHTTLLLKLGFKVMVFITGAKGSDPDDLVKSKEWKDDEFMELLNDKSIDAVEYIANDLFKDANKPFEKNKAREDLTRLLAQIPDGGLRNTYIKELNKKYSVDKTSVEKQISIEDATKSSDEYQDGNIKLPNHLGKDELQDWKEFGFFSDRNKKRIGYYFPNASFNHPERISNFIIKPLFQVASMTDSKRIVEIENSRKKILISIPNKALVSPQHFEEVVTNQGNFWFNGSRKHFQKLRMKVLSQFAFCREIRTLGWQKAGFYSFANGIVDGTFKRVDDYGICQYGEEQFFLPAFSSVYSQLEEEDDVFESDRHFVFRPSGSGVNFSKWAKQMELVHLENGRWSALFLLACLFRDHVFECLSYFPLMFGFGQIQTGKSACARAVNSVFFGGQTPFNLSSGTQVGFFRKLAQVRNAVSWLDEYTNDIDEKRFQAMKAGYDGAGHEKGVMSNDNRNKVTKPNSGMYVTGQYLPTRDDNSLFTRSCVLYFERKAEDVTVEERREFEKLTKWQREGLSDIIVEAVKFRDLFVEEFEFAMSEIVERLKGDLNGKDYKGRIMDNFAVLLTCNKILEKPLKLPFVFEDTYKMAVTHILRQSEQVSDSDALRGFWKMIEFLSYQFGIKEHEDYIIQETNRITIREGRTGSREMDFGKTKRVLLIRFTKIHPLYMQEHRKQHGENGVSEQSIKAYIKSSKSFFGIVKTVNFNGNRTSGYAFDYDHLNIDLKLDIAPEKKEHGSDDDDLPF